MRYAMVTWSPSAQGKRPRWQTRPLTQRWMLKALDPEIPDLAWSRTPTNPLGV